MSELSDRLRDVSCILRCDEKIRDQAADELDRLQALLDTITDGAEWRGWESCGIAYMQYSWGLPNCDGRGGVTLLEAAEKARNA